VLQLLEDKRRFYQFLQDYNITKPIQFDESTIHLIKDNQMNELADLRTPEDNEAAADTISAVIRGFARNSHNELHVSLAHQLDRWISSGETNSLPANVANKLKDHKRVALPCKLAKNAYKSTDGNLLAKIPAWLDAEREKEQGSEIDAALRDLKSLFGAKPQTYYGLILMDGDHMGQWLAGGESKAITYLESFHPKVRDGFNKHAERIADIKNYGNQKRALSPNRHLAIPGALNDFSLTVVRHVVEEEFLGRLIYAGGDDVFAMLPVADLLPAMQRLRYAYSGWTICKQRLSNFASVRKAVCGPSCAKMLRVGLKVSTAA
jgi:hypothetical protein